MSDGGAAARSVPNSSRPSRRRFPITGSATACGRGSPGGRRSIINTAIPWKTRIRKLEYDLYYIKNMSPSLDSYIILSHDQSHSAIAWFAIDRASRTAERRLDSPEHPGETLICPRRKGFPAERSAFLMLRRVLAVLILSHACLRAVCRAGHSEPRRSARGHGTAARSVSARTSISSADLRYRPGRRGRDRTLRDNWPISASTGIQVAGGISGAHSWRHTKLGLDYHGSVYHYFRQTYYDTTNHSLLLSLTHQFTRHAILTLAETAGMYSQRLRVTGTFRSGGLTIRPRPMSPRRTTSTTAPSISPEPGR